MNDPVNRQQIPWWDRRNEISDRAKKAANRGSWSSYWMDEDTVNYFYGKKKKKTYNGTIDDMGGVSIDIETANRLRQVRNAVTNFVTILTNRSDLKVVFSSGNQSYTDNNYVVISADDDPDNFDAIVGTAMHEGAHCAFSGPLFERLRRAAGYASSRRSIMEEAGIDKSFMFDLDNRGFRFEDQFKFFKTIMNVLEDRRIDSEIYHRAPGYRPYYKAFYEVNWQNPGISFQLIHNQFFQTTSLLAYEYRLTNISNPVTKYTLDVLPSFREIYDEFDLDHIRRLSNRDGTVNVDKYLQVVGYIFNTVCNNCTDFTSNPNDIDKQCNGTGGGRGQQGQSNSNLDNYDLSDNPLTEDQKKEIEKKMQEEGNGVENDGKSTSDTIEESRSKALDDKFDKSDIDKNTKDIIDAMDDGDAELDEVSIYDIKFNYIRIPKMTDSVYDLIIPNQIKNLRFEDKEPEYISKGRRLGQIITNKIKIRHDNNSTKYSRRNRGKIDPRLIHTIPSGNENLFFNVVEDSYRDTVIYITLDCSSSIDSVWEQIMTTAVGFGYASKKINNFDVVINLRYGLCTIWSITLFDSRIDNINHLYKNCARFRSSGYTPESIVYQIEEKYIQSLKNTDNNLYFITLTDGGPNYNPAIDKAGRIIYSRANDEESFTVKHSDLDNSITVKHTHKMMNKFKEIGIRPKAYFISSWSSGRENQAFKKSYKEGATIIDMNNFHKIAQDLNKFLTERV